MTQMYTTKYPAGHPGNVERPNHCPVYTPDGGVIMCSTPADAARVADALNGYGAMREAARAVVQAWTHDEIGQVDGELIETLSAALNPLAAKEGA